MIGKVETDIRQVILYDADQRREMLYQLATTLPTDEFVSGVVATTADWFPTRRAVTGIQIFSLVGDVASGRPAMVAVAIQPTPIEGTPDPDRYYACIPAFTLEDGLRNHGIDRPSEYVAQNGIRQVDLDSLPKEVQMAMLRSLREEKAVQVQSQPSVIASQGGIPYEVVRSQREVQVKEAEDGATEVILPESTNIIIDNTFAFAMDRQSNSHAVFLRGRLIGDAAILDRRERKVRRGRDRSLPLATDLVPTAYSPTHRKMISNTPFHAESPIIDVAVGENRIIRLELQRRYKFQGDAMTVFRVMLIRDGIVTTEPVSVTGPFTPDEIQHKLQIF